MNSIEVIRQVAKDEIKKLHLVELGLVTDVHPHTDDSDRDNYECSVKLKTNELELRHVPVATQLIGLTYAPRVGDLVLLTFVNGNVNAPIVIGRMYNDEDRPPLNNAGEVIFESPDSEDSSLRRIYFKFPGGTELTVKDDELNAKIGDAKLVIKKDGSVTLEAKDVTVKASGDLKMKAGGDVAIEGSGNVNIKGNMVNIN